MIALTRSSLCVVLFIHILRCHSVCYQDSFYCEGVFAANLSSFFRYNSIFRCQNSSMWIKLGTITRLSIARRSTLEISCPIWAPGTGSSMKARQRKHNRIRPCLYGCLQSRERSSVCQIIMKWSLLRRWIIYGPGSSSSTRTWRPAFVLWQRRRWYLSRWSYRYGRGMVIYRFQGSIEMLLCRLKNYLPFSCWITLLHSWFADSAFRSSEVLSLY